MLFLAPKNAKNLWKSSMQWLLVAACWLTLVGTVVACFISSLFAFLTFLGGIAFVVVTIIHSAEQAEKKYNKKLTAFFDTGKWMFMLIGTLLALFYLEAHIMTYVLILGSLAMFAAHLEMRRYSDEGFCVKQDPFAVVMLELEGVFVYFSKKKFDFEEALPEHEPKEPGRLIRFPRR